MVPRKNNIRRRLLAARRAAVNYLARLTKRNPLPRGNLSVRHKDDGGTTQSLTPKALKTIG
jgi:hypothetical protein